MSLISTIPVGSKTSSVSLHSSPHTNEVLLATGSWDQGESNEINFFNLKFDLDTMESETNLQSSQVTYSRLGMISNVADINDVKYLDYGNLLVARGDGVLGLVKQNGRTVERLESRPSACLSLDIVGTSQVAAVYRDGHVSFGKTSPSPKLESLQIPLAFAPTQAKWCDSIELAISTANSKVLFYDIRSTSAPSSIISIAPQAHRYRPLKIRSLDTVAFDPLILCTGDDEGMVRVWDRRNLLRPVAESTAVRKPITSVQFHSSVPSCIISSAIDGSILQHRFDANQGAVEDVWQMPSAHTPAPVNNVAMLGSLSVAAMDNADVIVWRSL